MALDKAEQSNQEKLTFMEFMEKAVESESEEEYKKIVEDYGEEQLTYKGALELVFFMVEETSKELDKYAEVEEERMRTIISGLPPGIRKNIEAKLEDNNDDLMEGYNEQTNEEKSD